ncbi:MAG: Lrp/AsnC family transcriptional regulator [Janthinobacterium lividum]
MSLRFDQLDDIDRNLLSLLQVNARETASNLARKLGIARTTVIARIARLERNDIISAYSIRLGKEIDVNVLNAYVGITLQPKSARDVVKRFAKMPEIQVLCAVSGQFDYVAWLRANSPERLDELLDEIGDIEGVDKTTTSVVLARKIDRGSGDI